MQAQQEPRAHCGQAGGERRRNFGDLGNRGGREVATRVSEVVQVVPPQKKKFHGGREYGASMTVGVRELTAFARSGALVLRPFPGLRTL